MMGKEVGESSSNQIPSPTKIDERLPMRRKLFSPRKDNINEKMLEKAMDYEQMMTDNFELDG